MKISFEDIHLRSSNSIKQYKCPRDDGQPGYNTDVPNVKYSYTSVRPPQVENAVGQIALSIHSLPTSQAFLLHSTSSTRTITLQSLHCLANFPWTPLVWHWWVALTLCVLLPIFLEPQTLVVNIQSWPFDLGSAGTSEATHRSSRLCPLRIPSPKRSESYYRAEKRTFAIALQAISGKGAENLS